MISKGVTTQVPNLWLIGTELVIPKYSEFMTPPELWLASATELFWEYFSEHVARGL